MKKAQKTQDKNISCRHGLQASSRLSGQAGFSIIEMLVALSIFTVMIGVGIFAFQGNQSRGVSLYSQLTQYGDAFKRMRLDTQCYPVNTSALFDYEASSDSHCGLDLQNNWNGPYAESTQVVSDGGNIALNQYAEDASLVLPPASSGLNSTNNRIQYAVVANNIPSEIINVVMNECNSGYADAEQTTFKQGQCFILSSPASSDTAITSPQYNYLTDSSVSNSVGYVFDESR